MAILDFILNCACLLLWLNWRSRGIAGVPRTPGIALVGTLRRAERTREDRWPSPLVLLLVLFLRSILYRQFGSAVRWTAALPLGPITLHFRSDDWGLMLAYSLVSFVVFLAGFYFCLIPVAAVNGSPRNDRWSLLVRAHLGPLVHLPNWLLLIVPYLATFCFWLLFAWAFGALGLQLPPANMGQVVQEASVVGLNGWLVWRYVVALVLGLYVLSSYVYLGNAPLWLFISNTARAWLRPLEWLPIRVGKLDLAPVLALAVVIALWMFSPVLLSRLFDAVAR
jgi:hypothetical protein